MILHRLVPVDPAWESVEVDAPGSSGRLDALYAIPRPRWLRTNLVTGVDGGARGADGISDGLSTAADRRILGAIRRSADVVLVGAATIRAEGFHVPRAARLGVVTATGDFGGATIPIETADRVTIYCPRGRGAEVARRMHRPGARVVELEASDGRIEPESLIDALHGEGAESIVCEGGPSLAGLLLDAGLVDELCMTTTGVLSDGASPVFAGGGAGSRLRLTQLLCGDDGTLFARWQVLGGSGTQ